MRIGLAQFSARVDQQANLRSFGDLLASARAQRPIDRRGAHLDAAAAGAASGKTWLYPAWTPRDQEWALARQAP